MTRHFETGKHLKKRHFIQKIPTTHPQEKMAVFKGTIESSTNHNDKETVKKSEPTVTAPASDIVATPMMTVKKAITLKNKNWRNHLIDQWQKFADQFHHFFKRLCSYF
jgi:hypothetical protein